MLFRALERRQSVGVFGQAPVDQGKLTRPDDHQLSVGRTPRKSEQPVAHGLLRDLSHMGEQTLLDRLGHDFLNEERVARLLEDLNASFWKSHWLRSGRVMKGGSLRSGETIASD